MFVRCGRRARRLRWTLAAVIYAFATTLLFALSTVLANRSLQAVGTVRANIGRLLVGLVFLSLWAFTAGRGLQGDSLPVFLLSGVAGMGVGDAAFFAALPFLGSRLTIMLMQCLSVPIAMLVEWLWLGTRLSAGQILASTIVLGGIVMALVPTRKNPPRVRVRPLGVMLGALAAAGQGVGAVLSRKGFALAEATGAPIDGLSAAFQRLLGGIVLTVAFYALWGWWFGRNRPAPAAPPPPPTRPFPGRLRWILLHGLAGPVFGMGSFQLALAHAPSGIVLPITATTPLFVIPIAYWLEGERPSRRSITGGIIAVSGAVLLTLVK